MQRRKLEKTKISGFEENTVALPQALLLSTGLEKLLKRLAKETSYEKVCLVGNPNNNSLELKTDIEAPAIVKFTEEYANIDINKRPSYKLELVVGDVMHDYQAGNLDFICQHVRLQEIYLDRYRSSLGKLKQRIKVKLHDK